MTYATITSSRERDKSIYAINIFLLIAAFAFPIMKMWHDLAYARRAISIQKWETHNNVERSEWYISSECDSASFTTNHTADGSVAGITSAIISRIIHYPRKIDVFRLLYSQYDNFTRVSFHKLQWIYLPREGNKIRNGGLTFPCGSPSCAKRREWRRFGKRNHGGSVCWYVCVCIRSHVLQEMINFLISLIGAETTQTDV